MAAIDKPFMLRSAGSFARTADALNFSLRTLQKSFDKLLISVQHIGFICILLFVCYLNRQNFQQKNCSIQGFLLLWILKNLIVIWLELK